MPNHKVKGRYSKGVLFDVDGTLVDSSYIHTIAWWQAFRQAGFDVPMARIHRCVGMGGPRLVDHLLPDERDKAPRRHCPVGPLRDIRHVLAVPSRVRRSPGPAGPVL